MTKFTTEKVDIEKKEEKPIFEELHKCLKKLLDLTESFDEEDLKIGYYVAKCRNIPPKVNEVYYYLKFKQRDDSR